MIIFTQGKGCLLPLLIILNLFFGWIFLKPRYWLLLEAILLLLFIANSYIFSRKIFSASSRRNNVIDVEGKVVEDRHPLKRALKKSKNRQSSLDYND
jgi:hypothetical protein